MIIIDNTEKANTFISYYACIFWCDHNIAKMPLANLDETFIIDTKMIRKWLAKIGRNKSAGWGSHDSFPS
jgi:hypothetical protein